MARDPNYQFSATKVYNLLVERFPSIFQRLRQCPESLPNPGNQPSRPILNSRSSVQIDPTDTFVSIAEKLKVLCEHADSDRVGCFGIDFEEGKFLLFREVVSTTYHPGVTRSLGGGEIDDMDDWTDDRDVGYNSHTYGAVNRIDVNLTHRNPNYDREYREYQLALTQWEQKTKSRRERTEKINVIKKENHDKIGNAQKNHRELWIAAGRELRDGSSIDLLQVKRDALRHELEQIEQKLAEAIPNLPEGE